MDDRERHAAGMKVRRAVLGDAWVDKAQAKLTPFNTEFRILSRAMHGARSGPDQVSIAKPAPAWCSRP